MITSVRAVLTAIVLAVLSLSCNASIEKSDFDRLCQIYEEHARKPIDLSLREGAIADEIKTELPVFFDRHYQYILDYGFSDRYEQMQRVAEHELGVRQKWNCDVMRRYFDHRFDVE